MGDRTYAELAVTTQFRDLAELLAKELGETFDETDERDGLVVFIRHEANYGDMPIFERELNEHAVPYDLHWDAGSDFGPGGRQLRVKRNADGVLERTTHEYFETMRQIDAEFVAEQIDSGDTSELRRTAANAIIAGSPMDAVLEDAQFLAEHQASLEGLRRAAPSA